MVNCNDSRCGSDGEDWLIDLFDLVNDRFLSAHTCRTVLWSVGSAHLECLIIIVIGY